MNERARATAANRLARLALLAARRGPEVAREKCALVVALSGAELGSATEIVRLHELLLFLRAFPDDPRTLAVVEQALLAFRRRRDLRRRRDELDDTGIAGTALHSPFFHPTARRLALRSPERLTIDWRSFEDEEELAPLVAALLTPSESTWVRERAVGARATLAALAARVSTRSTDAPRSDSRRTDAITLLDRLDALPVDDLLREALHDRAAPFYRLAQGPGGQNRTEARAPGSAIVFRSQPFERRRPDLAAELALPPRAVHEVRGREANELVELARDAMVSRARDLDCFAYGDARDVRRIVHDDGLEFVAIGSRPDRRLQLSAAYGLLTVRNGVPTGYVQLDGFLGTALVHFNLFETFRGTDAAWVFARALATARFLFRSEAFAIEPYQLGHGNDEALDSGAWWFYRKLGFEPRHAAAVRLANAEARRLARSIRARSSRATLARLAQVHLYWEPLGRVATVPPHAAIARAATAAYAARSEPLLEARVEISRRAAELARLTPHSRSATAERSTLSAAERLWLERWAPIIVSLPGIESWSAPELTALGALVRAKAARRESELVPLLAAHARFGPALLELARRHGAAHDLAPAR